MNRVPGIFLLLAGSLGLWLLFDSTLATDVVIALTGIAAALAVGLVIAGGLCFMTECRVTPRTFAEALLRIPFLAKELVEAVLPVARRVRVRSTERNHSTQEREP